MILVAVFLEDPSQWVSLKVEGQPVKIGRNPETSPGEDALRIPWRDRIVSRNHSLARRSGEELILKRISASPGRLPPNRFFTNAPHAERERLEDPLRLKPGQSFSIGSRGRTAFFWLRSLDEMKDAMAHQRPFGGDVPFQPPRDELSDATQRVPVLDDVDQLDEYSLRFQLRLLQRELPEKVLSGWHTEQELFTRTADFLKTALPGQKNVSVAFLALEASPEPGEPPNFEILNEEPAARADFRVSASLLKQVKLRQASPDDAYYWKSESSPAPGSHESSVLNRVDWVAILPVASQGQDAHVYRGPRGLPVYLYVAAKQSNPVSAESYTSFLRLAGSLVASLLAARERQRIEEQLSSHFSPALRRILREGRVEMLKPALAECTVLFGDRRGVSELMEAASTDLEILDQLRENQEIMGHISKTVFEYDGVITDFAGDGVLALWGWPVAMPDHAVRAASTAEAVASSLRERVEVSPDGHRIPGIRMGISTGRIAVGNTGPVQQVHISVFGAAVNFGARLEALGKQFQVPALLSNVTCRHIRHSGKTVRKLCFLRPAGFRRSYPIYELVLPQEVGGSGATPEQIADYERALDLFVARDWPAALQILDALPDDDEPAHWLAEQARFLSRHQPGPSWQGEILSDVK